MAVIKVNSSDKKTQGEFVLIDEKDFDEKIHVLYSDKPEKLAAKATSKTRAAKEPVESVDDGAVSTRKKR